MDRHVRFLGSLLGALVLLCAAICRSAGADGQPDVRRVIILQGFGWSAEHGGPGNWYDHLAAQAPDLARAGFTTIWFPPPSKDRGGQVGNGYCPCDYYDLGDFDQFGCLETRYGSKDELIRAVQTFHRQGMKVLGDLVLNHRASTDKDAQGRNCIYRPASGKAAWGPWANCHFSDCRDSGASFATDDVCHANPTVMADLVEWVRWLQREVGYDGWRLDYVKGYEPRYALQVLEATGSPFAVGEFWTDMGYRDGRLDPGQDAHRQATVDWVDGTRGNAWAFDFTTKGILQQAVRNEFWRLRDKDGKPPGVIGWWPGRAVTFVDNHDTGSRQAHWPFPPDKLELGYAYVLTHPGIPCVFWEHFVGSPVRPAVEKLIGARRAAGIHAESAVSILEARPDLYAARVGKGSCSLVVKLGPASWCPGDGWAVQTSGDDYAVWLPSVRQAEPEASE